MGWYRFSSPESSARARAQAGEYASRASGGDEILLPFKALEGDLRLGDRLPAASGRSVKLSEVEVGRPL